MPPLDRALQTYLRAAKAEGPGSARAQDAVSVQVRAPMDRGQRVSFLSLLENITVQPGEAAARVIVNSRTGTVVIGSHVKVMPAAVTHGNLSVTISEDTNVSQPPGLSRGRTAVTRDSQIVVEADASRMFLFNTGVTLDTIVRAVNQVGAAPGEVVSDSRSPKVAAASATATVSPVTVRPVRTAAARARRGGP